MVLKAKYFSQFCRFISSNNKKHNSHSFFPSEVLAHFRASIVCLIFYNNKEKSSNKVLYDWIEVHLKSSANLISLAE